MESAALDAFFKTQWNADIEKHSRSLDNDDLETIDKYKSWDSIQANVFNDAPQSILLIRPSMEHLNVFTNFFSKNLATFLDPSFLWGALGCLLQVVIESEDLHMLSEIPRMIKHLVNQAEAFNGFCSAMSEVGNLTKEACFDMQLLYLDFYVSAIRCIHDPGEMQYGGSSSIQLLERRYISTVQDLKEALRRIKRLIQSRSSQIQPLVKTAEDRQPPPKTGCLMLPEFRSTRMFNRVDIYKRLDELLAPTIVKTFRSVALHGMGGVGKSTIASNYIESKHEEHAYDTILWAHGEKPISLKHSFTEIALRLRLPGANAQNHDENLVLVQDWFRSTDSRWLIVYDNADSAITLMPYWPVSSHGRAIITTRNHSLAFEPASHGVEITSWDARTGSEFLFFLLKENIGRDLEAEGTSAYALSERLSGHALALSHMAGLIYEGELSIEEFMKMYLKNPRRAHATDTLSALWDFSFRSLDEDSLRLIGVLSYLMPDLITQDLFESREDEAFPKEMEFCLDGFSFSAALSKLIKKALVKKERDRGNLTIHRMVQTQLKQFLGIQDRQQCFNNAVHLVSNAFPNNLSQGQLYDRWNLCNRYLQHVLNLKDCYVEETKISKLFQPSLMFCTLLQFCQRFLSEMNALTELRSLCEVNLQALNRLPDGPRKLDLKASTLSHQAQAAESLGDPLKSIELNLQCYQIWLEEEPCKKKKLCFSANNIAYCHNTANLHEESEKWYEKSKYLWEACVENGEDDGDRPARHIKNHARCLVYLGKYDKADAMFDISITRLMIEKPLNWAMLGYALFARATMDRRQRHLEAAEGHYIEAQNAWLKGDQTRAHPFYASCLYKIGVCCLDQGKVEAAIKHFRDSMEVTKIHMVDRAVEHARNMFKLSEALLQDTMDDSQAEAIGFREEAENALRRVKPNATKCDTENDYDELIPIFWR